MIVGVDNGLDGGLCAISKFDGSLIEKIRMPTLQMSKKKEIDIRKVHQWIMDLNTPFIFAVDNGQRCLRTKSCVRRRIVVITQLPRLRRRRRRLQFSSSGSSPKSSRN